MKSSKKLAIILVAVLMLTTLLAGCTNEKTDENIVGKTETKAPEKTSEVKESDSDDSIYNPVGELPIAKELVSISVFMSVVPSIIVEGNEYFPWIKELTNIDVELTTVADDVAKEKTNLMLASATDLPDVMNPSYINYSQVTEYGSQGLFVNLLDYTHLTPHFELMKELSPEIYNSNIAGDGNVYSFPKSGYCTHCDYYMRMWINQTWLDNLELKMPETTDEYYDTLVAFKEQDANGNGDTTDEIPLIAFTNGWGVELFGFLMSPFNPTSEIGQLYLYLQDGEVSSALTDDGFKDGVEYIKKLYQEKLLDEESFSIKKDQVKVLTANEKGNRIGSIPEGGGKSWLDQSSIHPSVYVAVPPLAGPDGTRTSTRNPGELNLDPRWMITKDTENLEAAIRLGDLFMIDRNTSDENYELGTALYMGPTGYTLYDDPLLKSLSGEQAKVSRTWIWGEPNDKNFQNSMFSYNKYDPKRDYLYILSSDYQIEKVLWDVAVEYKKYDTGIMEVPRLVLSAEKNADAAEYKTILTPYIQEQLAAFVMGTRDLGDWDQFVQELKDLGLDTYVGIMKEAYAIKYK